MLMESPRNVPQGQWTGSSNFVILYSLHLIFPTPSFDLFLLRISVSDLSRNCLKSGVLISGTSVSPGTYKAQNRTSSPANVFTPDDHLLTPHHSGPFFLARDKWWCNSYGVQISTVSKGKKWNVARNFQWKKNQQSLYQTVGQIRPSSRQKATDNQGPDLHGHRGGWWHWLPTDFGGERHQIWSQTIFNLYSAGRRFGWARSSLLVWFFKPCRTRNRDSSYVKKIGDRSNRFCCFFHPHLHEFRVNLGG